MSDFSSTQSFSPASKFGAATFQTMCDTISNVLAASTAQFAANARAQASNATRISVEDNFATAASRGDKLAAIVDTLGSVLASDQVAGQPETIIRTTAFDMVAKRGDAARFQHEPALLNGSVVVPDGALPTDQESSAVIISWRTAGPLFAVADSSPDNRSGLRSPLLSVSFLDAAGAELDLRNLPHPFLLALSTSNGAMDNESASCSHWNASGWQSDGNVAHRSANVLQCEFHHLTSFAAFFGPTNDLSGDLFSVRWVVVLLIASQLTFSPWGGGHNLTYGADNNLLLIWKSHINECRVWVSG